MRRRLDAWTFVKITTDAGIIGYGECTDWRAPHALAGGIRDLAPLVVGRDPGKHPRHRARPQPPHAAERRRTAGQVHRGYRSWRCGTSRARRRVPVHRLFGGPTRDRVRLYWSHFGSYRARYPQHLGTPPLRTWDDIAELGREAVCRGYTALKTNILAPGAPAEFWTVGDSNLDHTTLDTAVRLIATLREAVGPRVDICLDLNFRFRPEACIRLARALEPFDLRWIEIDMYDPAGATRHPRGRADAAGLAGKPQYRARLPALPGGHAVDVAVVDVPWNGLAQSVEIAGLAAAYEINVAPHNYYSHLSTFIAAQWSACVTNLAMMEIDVDSVPWRDEIVTCPPGDHRWAPAHPHRPGLGTDLNEAAIAKHLWPRPA